VNVVKSLLKPIRSHLENFGINFSLNSTTTGLTPKNEVVELLNRLRPQDNGHNLIRIGGLGDGGYLLPDDLSGISELFSPGSNQLSNFERDIADRWQIKSFICDSIDEKPTDLSPFQDFTASWVGPYSDGEKYISLEDWVREKSQTHEDLLLQIDIEGAEFQTLISTPLEILNRFRIIVIEIHFLEALKNRWAFELVYSPFFNKILKYFDVIHLHPNNCCGLWNYGEFQYPRIIELTLHRKDRGRHLRPLKTSRHDLDSPCVDSNPEISIHFSDASSELTIELG
jgi:hypothetical protein